MESMQNFLPEHLQHANFWMKFSLLKHGANLRTLLSRIRLSQHTMLAIETLDGQVFGSFTSTPWREKYGYFGTGESFVWRMRKSRLTPCLSLLEQAKMESTIETFPFTGRNEMLQVCQNNLIALGGGEINDRSFSSYGEHLGFALAVGDDLCRGTTSACATFNSPCLTNRSMTGDIFEIANLEAWTFTNSTIEDDAVQNELGSMFIREHTKKLDLFGILLGDPC